jgi:3-oxo-5-alpha-steroid 4-dehydrogenase 1
MLAQIQNLLIYGMLGLAVLTFLGTIKKVNPYGRHMQAGQSGTWPALPAWLLFESPQWFAFALTFWLTAQSPSPVALTLFALWQAHYIHRAILYPLRMRDRHKRFPLSGVVFGFVFNAANGFVNGYAVAHAPHLMSTEWFSDPRFIAGLAIAVVGWWINFQADSVLINLRKDGSTGYKIPYGGMFRYVSSANYFGEIVLWCGWALMSFTLAGFAFAVFTISNLLPRALSHHRWYRETFTEYPKDRKAIIPGVL